MLNSQKRKWIVFQAMKSKLTISDIARAQQVSRKTVYVLLKEYQSQGLYSLEDKPRGRNLVLKNFRGDFYLKFYGFSRA